MNEKKHNCTIEPTSQTRNAAGAPAEGDEIEFWGEVISVYSRAQAIKDGVLIDVSPLARKAGFRWPVAMTAGAWHDSVKVSPNNYAQDEVGRLWDVLNVLQFMIHSSPGASEISFFLTVSDENELGQTIRLRAVCGPGDDPAPVITIMLPGED